MVHEKPMRRRGLPKKGGLGQYWTICRFKGGGFAREGDDVSEEG